MTWRFAAVGFANGHVRSNVRTILEHPEAELVAVCDEHPESPAEWPPSMADVADELDIPGEKRYVDVERCLRETDPDAAFLGPTTPT